jgi:hypothetical protein
MDLGQPADAILQSGGDARLKVNPATGLNGYGASHTPRPWAITFASSTASSTSERGYAAAEAARANLAADAKHRGPDKALTAEANAIRQALAQAYGLTPGTHILLTASGTDCELLALAIAQAADPSRPIANLLIAPEETGSGVPLAATGRHFNIMTARGLPVEKGALIAGFRRDTTLLSVAARSETGAIRDPNDVLADCRAQATTALQSGARVVLHLLDVSKTGLLSPDPTDLLTLAQELGPDTDVVVDACQARLDPIRVRAYLEAGWIVLLTGSKFFTGPPFTGAVLIPPTLSDRLSRPLPAGLADYLGRTQIGDVPAAEPLPDTHNPGLLLRWRATLGEIDAFLSIPAAHRRTVLRGFVGTVRAGLQASPRLTEIRVPDPIRGDGTMWDEIQTILGFTIRGPDGAPLAPGPARNIYHWLNSDLSEALPTADQALTAVHCHIGQPAPLPLPGGATAGVLRISAGARLISGEPSHAKLDEQRRLEREFNDALIVMAKIELIMDHWDRLLDLDPQPTFR